MERLTYKKKRKPCFTGYGEYTSRHTATEVNNRLAAYEDTGYDPAELADKLEKLDRYEQAEKDGRIVVLPCKVGDMVYRLYTDGAGNIDDNGIDEEQTYEFYIDNDGLGISIGPYDGHIGHYTHEGCDTGVWKIFLSRAEAQAALQKSKNGGTDG